MEGLYNIQDWEADRPLLECLVFAGTRAEIVEYLQQNAHSFNHLLLDRHLELPEVMPETHRYFYPEPVHAYQPSA